MGLEEEDDDDDLEDEDDDLDDDEDEEDLDDEERAEIKQGDLLEDINEALGAALDAYVEGDVKLSEGTLEVELDDGSRWQLRLTQIT